MGNIITTGTFDGIHRGHVELLHTLVAEAERRGGEPVVVTFDRHPLAVIAPTRAPHMLMLPEDRNARLRSYGVAVDEVHFDEAMRCMNAGFKVYGIYRGYRGLIYDEIEEFSTQNVSNIIQRGGTILKTARCKEFQTPEGRQCAYDVLRRRGIDSLCVIGGDGSLTGARIFGNEFQFPIVGLPGTIDNDLYGTDTTIGYDTALNTIMDCVDKIRDTATSHERLFFIEVMGRDAGFLALNGAIASGAEAAIIPEISTQVDQLSELIKNGFRKSKNSSIVLVAESPITGGAMGLAQRVKEEYPGYDVRVTILGHLQRGGSPTANDRILASRMGAAAVDALLDDQRNVMIGIKNDEIVYIPFTKAIKNDKPINQDLLSTLRRLSI